MTVSQDDAVRVWNAQPVALGKEVVWSSQAKFSTGKPITQLFKTTWDNPKPDVAITGIDFASTPERGSAQFLVAITTE